MKRALISLSVILLPSLAFAASDTAQALQIVETAISIAQTSDLQFGTANQGDAVKTIAAGTSEGAENASFTISGEPNKSYVITLPANGDVTMVTDGGGVAAKEINVTDFTSYPAAGANGVIDATGQQKLYVGASRDAISLSQQSGSYADTFTVTVLY
jgi:hypothetical protein